MSMYESVDITQNGLLAGPEIPVLTKNVTITAGTAFKRGTLMHVKADLSAVQASASNLANAVVTNDADEKATVLTVYVSGLFERDELIVASGDGVAPLALSDDVAAHEESLRVAGIYVTSRK